ncbi:MAG: glycosyltransferase [Alistipes indistinctus]
MPNRSTLSGSRRSGVVDRYISDGDVAALSAADLVVQPYRHATQSGVTQIAYWFDVPMVVTGVGGLRELVPDGKVGYVTEPVRRRLRRKSTGFTGKGSLAEFRANILRFRERFTWERMIEFRSLYDRIAGTQPGQKR